MHSACINLLSVAQAGRDWRDPLCWRRQCDRGEAEVLVIPRGRRPEWLLIATRGSQKPQQVDRRDIGSIAADQAGDGVAPGALARGAIDIHPAGLHIAQTPHSGAPPLANECDETRGGGSIQSAVELTEIAVERCGGRVDARMSAGASAYRIGRASSQRSTGIR